MQPTPRNVLLHFVREHVGGNGRLPLEDPAAPAEWPGSLRADDPGLLPDVTRRPPARPRSQGPAQTATVPGRAAAHQHHALSSPRRRGANGYAQQLRRGEPAPRDGITANVGSIKPSWDASPRVVQSSGDPLYALLDRRLHQRGFYHDYAAAEQAFLKQARAARVRAVAEAEHESAAALWWYCTQVRPRELRDALETEERDDRVEIAVEEATRRAKLDFLFRKASEALYEELWALAEARRIGEQQQQWWLEEARREAAEALRRRAEAHETVEAECREDLLLFESEERLAIESGHIQALAAHRAGIDLRLQRLWQLLAGVATQETQWRDAVGGAQREELDALSETERAARASVWLTLAMAAATAETHARDDLAGECAEQLRGAYKTFHAQMQRTFAFEYLFHHEAAERRGVCDDEAETVRRIATLFVSGSTDALIREEQARRAGVEREAVDAQRAVAFWAAQSMQFVLWASRRTTTLDNEKQDRQRLMLAAAESLAGAGHRQRLREVQIAETRERHRIVCEGDVTQLMLDEARSRDWNAVLEFHGRSSLVGDLEWDLRDAICVLASHERAALHRTGRRCHIASKETESRRRIADLSWEGLQQILYASTRSASQAHIVASTRELFTGEVDGRSQFVFAELETRTILRTTSQQALGRLITTEADDTVRKEEMARAQLHREGIERFWPWVCGLARVHVMEWQHRQELALAESITREEDIRVAAARSTRTAVVSEHERRRPVFEADLLKQHQASCETSLKQLRTALEAILERDRKAREVKLARGLASSKKFVGITAIERIKERHLQVEAMHVGGPAFQAGVLLDDVIAAVGDIPVVTRDDMRRAITAAGKVNQPLPLTIRRPKKPVVTEVPAESSAASQASDSTTASAKQAQQPPQPPAFDPDRRILVRVLCTDKEFAEFDFYFDPTGPKIGKDSSQGPP
jgi:hypothetical protein